ncbi:hypothetical protein ACFWG6_31170 [Streptomyces erythrochromogenes]|uniref:hypothetical protein n=1 Tax=Streptomyces erythrochromogenes TaxID=285574 RepID=UPI003636B684
MADTFPVSTDSPALAAHAPARRYTPSPEEQARAAAAAEHLAQVAAGLHEAPAVYERHGIDIEWHHQLDDPAVPPLLVRPYLTAGGQS